MNIHNVLIGVKLVRRIRILNKKEMDANAHIIVLRLKLLVRSKLEISPYIVL